MRSVSQARRPALDGVRFVLSRRDDTETCAPRRGDWPVHVQRDRTCMRTVRAYSIELPALVLGGAGKASSSPSVARPAGDETEQRAARARGLAFVVSHEPLPAATGTGTARHTQAFPFVPRPRDLSGRRPRQCVLHARFPACSLDGPTHKLLEGSDAGERWFY